MNTKNISIALIIILVAVGGYLIWSGNGFQALFNQSTSNNDDTGVVGDPSDAGNRLSEVTREIVGSWEDRNNDEFVREFKADGSVEERRNGSTEATGVWSAFTGNNPQGQLPLQEGEVYVAILTGDSPQYFRVEDLSSRSLELIYLDREESVTFKRVR